MSNTTTLQQTLDNACKKAGNSVLARQALNANSSEDNSFKLSDEDIKGVFGQLKFAVMEHANTLQATSSTDIVKATENLSKISENYADLTASMTALQSEKESLESQLQEQSEALKTSENNLIKLQQEYNKAVAKTPKQSAKDADDNQGNDAEGDELKEYHVISAEEARAIEARQVAKRLGQ